MEERKVSFFEAMKVIENGGSVRIHNSKLTRNIGLNKRMNFYNHVISVLSNEYTYFSLKDLIDSEWTVIDEENM